MLLSLTSRILQTVDPLCLAKIGWNFGYKGARSVMLHKQRMKQGQYFPPFFYISILNSCNLRCQGCWVDVDKPRESLNLDELNKIVNDAKRRGNAFFGILGGVTVAAFGLSPALLLIGAAYLVTTMAPAVQPRWKDMDRRPEREPAPAPAERG